MRKLLDDKAEKKYTVDELVKGGVVRKGVGSVSMKEADLVAGAERVVANIVAQTEE